MELGGISRISYTPKWNDNRDLPEGERLSLVILPPTAADVLQSGDSEDIYAWRDDLAASERARGVLRGATPSTLRRLRLLITCTTDLRNFTFDGEPVTDPVEVWTRLSVNAWELALEVYGEIDRVSTLTEEQAGNSDSPSDGASSNKTDSATGVEEGAPRKSASTKKEASGS